MSIFFCTSLLAIIAWEPDGATEDLYFFYNAWGIVFYTEEVIWLKVFMCEHKKSTIKNSYAGLSTHKVAMLSLLEAVVERKGNIFPSPWCLVFILISGRYNKH